MGKNIEIRHRGRICAITQEGVRVEILNKSMCAACHARSLCSLGDEQIKTISIKYCDSSMFSIGEEVEVVMQSEALLIANKNLSEEKQTILDELLFRFEAIQMAEGKKYVLLNAPKEQLDEIIEVLPGMRSPTITPLADGNWVSVQSVIAEKHFWEIIGKLKSLGAEGILVLPIEKMIL